jgi:hypothetical protein
MLYYILLSILLINNFRITNSTKIPKFCVNCNHFLPDNKFFLANLIDYSKVNCKIIDFDKYALEYSRCTFFPKNNNISLDDENFNKYLVTGKSKIKKNSLRLFDYNYCTTARNDENMCGKDGLKFQEKK